MLLDPNGSILSLLAIKKKRLKCNNCFHSFFHYWQSFSNKRKNEFFVDNILIPILMPKSQWKNRPPRSRIINYNVDLIYANKTLTFEWAVSFITWTKWLMLTLRAKFSKRLHRIASDSKKLCENFMLIWCTHSILLNSVPKQFN